MQRLVDAHLFGAGLIDIETPVLVGRYNDCLQQLGIEPTQLKRFKVDGMGWSPEIALEKKDNLYLSNGIPNHLAIIISPDQKKRPIYFPFNSYDRRLMEAYFEEHERSIVDITRTMCIGLDIDEEITRYASPRDLLLVDYIVIRSFAGQLMEAAREQKELVAQFNHEGLAWFDKEFRQRIVASAEIYGDLRYRRVEIPDMRFEDLRSFYTRAFGGVFIIRDIAEDVHLLVVKNSKLIETTGNAGKDICCTLQDPKLLEYVMEGGLINVNVGWYRTNRNILGALKEKMIMDAICQDDASLDPATLNNAKKKRRLAKIQGCMPVAFSELERFMRTLERGIIPQVKDLSCELRLMLLRPREDLRMSLQRVLWQLICKLQGQLADPFVLYTYDKEYFFQQYQSWPESKKAWVVRMLQRQYVPMMNA